MEFFVKQQRYRIQVAAVLAHRLANLLALAGARAYIHSCDIALNHMAFFVTGFAILFGAMLYSARVYLHHWTLT